MYVSGVIVAFVMVFVMLIGNARVRRLEGRESTTSGIFDTLFAAAISATLSWLMVAVCIVMFFVKNNK